MICSRRPEFLILVGLVLSVFLISCSKKKSEANVIPKKSKPQAEAPPVSGNPTGEKPPSENPTNGNPSDEEPIAPPVPPGHPPDQGGVPPVEEPKPPQPSQNTYRLVCSKGIGGGVRTFNSHAPDDESPAFLKLIDESTAQNENRPVDPVTDRLTNEGEAFFISSNGEKGKMIFAANRLENGRIQRAYFSDVDLLYSRGLSTDLGLLPAVYPEGGFAGLGLPQNRMGILEPRHFLIQSDPHTYTVFDTNLKQVDHLNTGAEAYNPRVQDSYLIFDARTENGTRPQAYKFSNSDRGFNFQRVSIPFKSDRAYSLTRLDDSRWAWFASDRGVSLVIWDSSKKETKTISFERGVRIPPNLAAVEYEGQKVLVVGAEVIRVINSYKIKVEKAELQFFSGSGRKVETLPYPQIVVAAAERRGKINGKFLYFGSQPIGEDEFVATFEANYFNSPFMYSDGLWKKISGGGCGSDIGVIREK
ncbi:MAG: hypothetical protein AB7O96_02820 [Pseudobdellovibrionaceae bacterium]